MDMELLSLMLVIIYKESLLKVDAKEKDAIFEKMEVIMKGNFETVLLMALENSVMEMGISTKVSGRLINLMVVDKLSTRMEVDIMANSSIIADMEKGS